LEDLPRAAHNPGVHAGPQPAPGRAPVKPGRAPDPKIFFLPYLDGCFLLRSDGLLRLGARAQGAANTNRYEHTDSDTACMTKGDTPSLRPPTRRPGGGVGHLVPQPAHTGLAQYRLTRRGSLGLVDRPRKTVCQPGRPSLPGYTRFLADARQATRAFGTGALVMFAGARSWSA